MAITCAVIIQPDTLPPFAVQRSQLPDQPKLFVVFPVPAFKPRVGISSLLNSSDRKRQFLPDALCSMPMKPLVLGSRFEAEIRHKGAHTLYGKKRDCRFYPGED